MGLYVHRWIKSWSFFFKDGSLIMMILKHVDDLKMPGPKAEIVKFVDFLSGGFGKLEIDKCQ